MDVFTVARGWLALSIAVVPILFRSKLPDARALRLTGHTDHGRASWQSLQEHLPTEAQVKAWTAGPRVNLAVVTGWQGLVVLDFDTPTVWQMYQAWLADNPEAATVIDLTYKVHTGRGIHVYIGVAEPVKNGHLGAIDIKAAGGYVLTPPSVHPSGRVYQAVDQGAPICTVDRLTDVFPFEYSGVAQYEGGVVSTPATEQPDPLVTAGQVYRGSMVQAAKQHHIEEFFAHLQATGNGYFLTRCPFHADDNPSFWLDTTRQLCGCLSGCTTKPLDVINLYARLHGLSNREAVFALAQN